MIDYKFHSIKINGVRKLNYNFDSYLRDVNTLYKNIANCGTKYDLIVGIERGGLIPAVHLSNMLDVPMTTLKWSITKDQRDKTNEAILSNKDKNILLVDDILDVGHTIHEIHQHYGKLDTAVLIYNCINQFSIVPEFAAWVINREEMPSWIDYWWEKV